MDVQGAWQLELAIPEKRAGADLRGPGEKRRTGAPRSIPGRHGAGEKLPGDAPGSLGTSVDSTDLVEPFLPAWASIPPVSLAEPRVGAEIDAKIRAGIAAP